MQVLPTAPSPTTTHLMVLGENSIFFSLLNRFDFRGTSSPVLEIDLLSFVEFFFYIFATGSRLLPFSLSLSLSLSFSACFPA